MKAIFYCVYGAGVLAGLLFTRYLPWDIAFICVFILPILSLYLAEQSGRVQFGEYDKEPDDGSIISTIIKEDLSDKDAAKKYGWAVVNEMDERLKSIEEVLQEAKKKREKFVSMIKEEPPK
jgi:hypothetical protein